MKLLFLINGLVLGEVYFPIFIAFGFLCWALHCSFKWSVISRPTYTSIHSYGTLTNVSHMCVIRRNKKPCSPMHLWYDDSGSTQGRGFFKDITATNYVTVSRSKCRTWTWTRLDASNEALCSSWSNVTLSKNPIELPQTRHFWRPRKINGTLWATILSQCVFWGCQ